MVDPNDCPSTASLWRRSDGIPTQLLNYTWTTIFGITLIVAGLTPCTGAPSSDPWWLNPCTRSVEVKTRHSRSAENKIIIDQLNKTIKSINMEFRNLRLVYSKSVKNRMPLPKRLKWLKLKKSFKDMLGTKNTQEALNVFQGALQYYAGTLDMLKRKRIQDVEFDLSKRKVIINSVENNIRLLLCETRSSVENFGLPLKNVRNFKVKDFPKDMTLTSLHATDVSFFTKLRKFLVCSKKYFMTKRFNRKCIGVRTKSKTKRRKVSSSQHNRI